MLIFSLNEVYAQLKKLGEGGGEGLNNEKKIWTLHRSDEDACTLL